MPRPPDKRRSAAACWTLLLLALLCCARPARAQQLSLSTYADWYLLDQEWRDPKHHVSTSRFVPRLNLWLTGPLRPGARLYLDVAGTFSQDVGDISRQSADNTQLTLRGEAPHYQFSLRHGKSHFTSSTDVLGLAPVRLNSGSTDTALALTLREPAWPLFTMQYERFAADSNAQGLVSSANSTSSRLSGIYDLRPFRFQFDTSRYSTASPGSPGSGATSRRLGANFDSAILPGLTLTADLRYDRLENHFGLGSVSGFSDRLALVRAQAVPTPKVALTAEVRSQVNSGLFGDVNNDSNLHGSSLDLRTEVLPGLQLNLARDANRVTRVGLPVTDTTTRADVFAQLNSRNSVTLSVSPSELSTGTGVTVQQRASRASWTSQLDSHTDLTLSVDRFTDDEGAAQSTRTNTQYAAVRYRPDLQTSLGLAVLSGKTDLTDTTGATNQSVSVVSGDCSWLPTRTLSLGLRLDLTRLSGTSSARISVPSLDVHWQPDARTDFALNWRVQSAVERALDQVGNLNAAAVSARFQHRLSRNSTLNIDYRLLTQSAGPLASERAVRVGVTTNLGQ